MAENRFDGLDIESLRRRKSEKWSSYPPEILPAWVAEMDFPVAEPIRVALQESLDHSDMGYPIAPGRTGIREAFAERMESRYGWRVDPHQVEVLSEVVQGLYLALSSFAGPGEGVVVQTPIYPPFLGGVEETARRLVEKPLTLGTEGWEIDFDDLAQNLDRETRIFLLCNPHNPSGRVFDRGELERIAELALEHDWVVVADEIHADLVFDERVHIPFASLAPEIEARTLTLNSASKSFNIPGLRCAVAHFGSPDLRKRLDAAYPRHIRGGLGLSGLYATIAAWRECDAWLDALRNHLEANRNYLMQELASRFPGIRCEAPQGTYLAWLDCSGLGWEESPYARFLERGQVALSDGARFGPGFEAFVRLNFATSREILEQVLARMESAIQAAD